MLVKSSLRGKPWLGVVEAVGELDGTCLGFRQSGISTRFGEQGNLPYYPIYGNTSATYVLRAKGQKVPEQARTHRRLQIPRILSSSPDYVATTGLQFP